MLRDRDSLIICRFCHVIDFIIIEAKATGLLMRCTKIRYNETLLHLITC